MKNVISCLVIIILLLISCQQNVMEIERPEKIVSKRQIVYDQETYSNLEQMWKTYYANSPSGDAYANWMYAARYANNPEYKHLLENGVENFPNNPTLLYLKALNTHGKENSLESIELLEKAIKLDSTFIDPWFVLTVDYLANSEINKSNTALNKLLTEGVVEDVVMDYNYNVISLLEQDAVLITNGDNDTYPSWILTKILKFRPDVKIVNRSLLNTSWYPIHIIQKEGLPNFISREELVTLREDIFNDIQNGKIEMPAMGPYSDTLLTSLIFDLMDKQRPVYLASTLFPTNVINKFMKRGINLGLVTKIKSDIDDYRSIIYNTISAWLTEFRTSGLSSWQLRYSSKQTAEKRLTENYAEALKLLKDSVNKFIPQRRLDLFNWYEQNIMHVLPKEKLEGYNSMWCDFSDIREINDWCKIQKQQQ